MSSWLIIPQIRMKFAVLSLLISFLLKPILSDNRVVVPDCFPSFILLEYLSILFPTAVPIFKVNVYFLYTKDRLTFFLGSFS